MRWVLQLQAIHAISFLQRYTLLSLQFIDVEGRLVERFRKHFPNAPFAYGWPLTKHNETYSEINSK